MHRLNVTVEHRSGEKDIEIAVSGLILFTWTGRDFDLVKKHVEEAAKIGIKGPRTIPEMYILQPYLITTSNYVKKISEFHSGEVEYIILVKNEDEIFITVGSDHTDREAEKCNVLAGKHMYPKIIARRAWPLNEVINHWDELILRSWILEDNIKNQYQEGKLRLLLPPDKLIEETRETVQELRNIVIFSGTIPTIRSELRISDYFEFELYDPLLKRSITHYYWID